MNDIQDQVVSSRTVELISHIMMVRDAIEEKVKVCDTFIKSDASLKENAQARKDAYLDIYELLYISELGDY